MSYRFVTSRGFSSLAFAAAACTAGYAHAGGRIYVDIDASPGGDGTSWATAYQDLQDAFDEVLGNGFTGEIWVAEGVYKPTFRTDPIDPRTATFFLFNDVGLYGGFSGVESQREERNPELHETILSGDIGVPDDPLDNATTVVTSRYNTSADILDGFTIRDGYAGNGGADRGAGIRFDGASAPRIVNCRITANFAAYEGAAMYGSVDGVEFVACEIVDNLAEAEGGAAGALSGDASFTDCIIAENHGGRFGMRGGGQSTFLRCSFSGNSANVVAALIVGPHATITGCEFKNNTAIGSTGALSIADGAVVGCSFINNSSGQNAGALTANGSDRVMIESCLFVGNHALEAGGAIFGDSAEVAILNCMISGNTAGQGGGIAHRASRPMLLTNTSIYGNTATWLGGGVWLYGESGSIITNTILWSNEDSAGSGEDAQLYSTQIPLISYSCVQGWSGGWGGRGNFGLDPLLVDPDGMDNVLGTADDNLRLSASSPCIDAGDNFALPDDLFTDFDGHPRYVDHPDVPDTGRGLAPIIDPGAAEFLPNSLVLSGPYPGQAGVENRLSIHNATPSRYVAFIWGTAPGKTAAPGCPGVFISIEAPHVIVQRADEHGVAELVQHVPAFAVGQGVLLQAFDPSSCSVSNLIVHVFD